MTASFHPSQDFVRAHRHLAPATITTATNDVAPNYLVRRVVAAVVALSALAAGAVAIGEVAGAVSDLGGRPAAASEIVTSAVSVHVAVPGDTLWSIAGRYRGEVDRGRYLDALISVNGGSATVEVGQAVRLP